MTVNVTRIAGQDEIPLGSVKSITADGRDILLCHTKDGYFAVDNLCSHAAARLCEGKLKGNRILCPLHGAAFDVRDGAALSRPATTAIASYPLRLDEDGIYVLLSSSED